MTDLECLVLQTIDEGERDLEDGEIKNIACMVETPTLDVVEEIAEELFKFVMEQKANGNYGPIRFGIFVETEGSFDHLCFFSHKLHPV